VHLAPADLEVDTAEDVGVIDADMEVLDLDRVAGLAHGRFGRWFGTSEGVPAVVQPVSFW
jgi:hypothetical protein